MAKQWGIERYKDFLISGSAVPTFATGFEWNSQGIIFHPGRFGSIEIKRIKEPCQKCLLFVLLSAFDRDARV
jgi:hypothetical protein